VVLEELEALLALEALQSMMGGHKRMVQIAGPHVETRGDLVQHFVVLVDTAAERGSVAVQWELQKLLHGFTHVLYIKIKILRYTHKDTFLLVCLFCNDLIEQLFLYHANACNLF